MSPDSAHGSGQVARSQDASDTLTTRQGHPVVDNQNMRTGGSRGPATLENYQFIEKITRFDRERIPERVVHARGRRDRDRCDGSGGRGRLRLARPGHGGRYAACHCGHGAPSGPRQAGPAVGRVSPASRSRTATPHSGRPTMVLKHPE